MRKVDSRIEDVIEKIKSLKGENVNLEIQRGRKKAMRISGTVESLYPSIFTIKTAEDKLSSFSCSYADVLCGDVRLVENDEKNVGA